MLAELIANYINARREKLGLSIKDISDATNDEAPESTVKNLCHKRVDNPGIRTLKLVMDAIGGSFDEMLYPERSKGEVSEAAILAQKELYEHQLATQKETNDTHVANIRAHYEQHVAEKNESFAKIEAHYEKRLTDKREMIEHLKEENEQLNSKLNEQEAFYNAKLKEQELGTRVGNLIRNIIIAFYVIATIVLLGLEFIHPEHGWIRW